MEEAKSSQVAEAPSFLIAQGSPDTNPGLHSDSKEIDLICR
jgi:hypothetical protein